MMKHVLPLFAAGALLLLCGCQSFWAKKEKPKDLILTSESKYQIVYPDRSKNAGTTALLKQVALKLQRAFKETLGADFPVVSESHRRATLKNIFLGNTRVLQSKGVYPLKRFKDFNFNIWEYNGNIYLAGCDRHRYNSSKAETRYTAHILGTAKAAVYFMEHFLDVRFLYPGEVGTDYVKKDKIVIPARYKYSGVPTLQHGLGRNYEMFYDYANSNHGPGTLLSHGGHSYYLAVPEKKYFKTHPEYFALLGSGKNKKRNANGNHLCISNKEVQELIYQQLLRDVDSGAETAELSQTDGYQPCQCEACAKYGNTSDIGEKLWILHRSLAERLLKDRPGKNAMIICYNPNRTPPKTFNEFPENVMIELCNYSPETFANWSKIKVPKGFLVYIYNWGWYNTTGATPKRTPGFVAEQARRFIKNKVKGVYRCGFGENFGLEGPTYYVYGKVLEDPARNEAELADEFYRRAFRESAAPMRTFYQTLYERLEIYSASAEKKISLALNPKALLNTIYSADLLDLLEKQLSRAEKLAKDPKVKQRLNLVRKEFDYTKLLARILALYNSYRLAPDRQALNVLLDSIEARNKMIDSIYDAKGRVKRLPGWKEIPLFGNMPKGQMKTNGRLRGPIEAPLTWNVKLLRTSSALPGATKTTMVIRKALEPVRFNDFESGAWKRASWQKLNGIQLGNVSEQTKFKILYDKENLYIGVVSDLPDKRPHTAVGNDGPAWREDAIELVIDPAGARSNYYHFIYNPVPDSCYESAVGFIEDVLHPLYNKADPSWNGKWTYETRRENNKWYSLMILPFDSIKAKPASGAMWTMNLGREIQIPKEECPPKGRRELALWAPSLESLGFHDKDCFGEAVFE